MIALSGSARWPSDSSARYGWMASAPYPPSSAKWCTSRAEPVSTTRPALVRRPARIRCWCTAEVASSAGMATRSASTRRSDTIRML
ncbi:Uncharacterised protein [Bordetella pertussis]|nr:Uncharacterised protein [Bordetella pertussis]CFW31550.1 Uncharacterised protein [Bordetella pertussis]